PQAPEAAGPRLTDPRRTWISFVHRPDDGSSARRRCKGKDKKLRGLVGPPGPPGPQGPPGAPGAEVTREVLLQEFKEILKGKGFHQVKDCKRVLEVKDLEGWESSVLVKPRDKARPSPQSIALASRNVPRCAGLKWNIRMDPPRICCLWLRGMWRSLLAPSAAPSPGLLECLWSPRSRILGMLPPPPLLSPDHSELKSKAQLRARDNVRVLICIESLCHRHTSLEVIAGLESNSKIFTIYVHGLLQLQAGQYTSIFVDNSAGAPITIQSGSDFMGMLLGA
ncbi:ADIPL protein, partial [Nicator chloris]|nr:ADIPL protein [Nicator chloris]